MFFFVVILIRIRPNDTDPKHWLLICTSFSNGYKTTIVKSSAVDPIHFDLDPDPRIPLREK